MPKFIVVFFLFFCSLHCFSQNDLSNTTPDKSNFSGKSGEIDKEKIEDDKSLFDVLDAFDEYFSNIIDNSSYLSNTVIDLFKTSDKESRSGLRNLVNNNRISFNCK